MQAQLELRPLPPPFLYLYLSISHTPPPLCIALFASLYKVASGKEAISLHSSLCSAQDPGGKGPISVLAFTYHMLWMSWVGHLPILEPPTLAQGLSNLSHQVSVLGLERSQWNPQSL